MTLSLGYLPMPTIWNLTAYNDSWRANWSYGPPVKLESCHIYVLAFILVFTWIMYRYMNTLPMEYMQYLYLQQYYIYNDICNSNEINHSVSCWSWSEMILYFCYEFLFVKQCNLWYNSINHLPKHLKTDAITFEE
jgi:hypothetical protein